MRQHLTRLAVVAVVLASLGAQSSSAAEDPDYPGLPKFESGAWIGPQVTGLNRVDRAKQWIRLPPIYLPARNFLPTGGDDNRCRRGGRYFPFKSITNYHATGFFLSDKGAPEPYGYVGPFTTRTVAFGSIPVEATIELRQPRDEQNLPIGIEIVQDTGEYCPGEGPYPDVPGEFNARYAPASVEGQVEVGITAVKVDGVDLHLGSTCRTTKPGELALTSREHFSANPENLTPGVRPTVANLMTTPYLNVALGGLLFGTADIPAFTGCLTASGEDVSKLLTAAVSGTDNPVTMRTNGLTQSCMVRQTGCPPPLPDMPFPAAE